MALPEDRYNFSVRAKDRVCVAITDRECLAGKKVELPPFALINGGLIAGQVVNTSPAADRRHRKDNRSARTARPVAAAGEGGFPAGWRPWTGPAGSPCGGPGGELPLLRESPRRSHGMGHEKQPAVVVKEGETTRYNMLVTPEVPPEEK